MRQQPGGAGGAQHVAEFLDGVHQAGLVAADMGSDQRSAAANGGGQGNQLVARRESTGRIDKAERQAGGALGELASSRAHMRAISSPLAGRRS